MWSVSARDKWRWLGALVLALDVSLSLCGPATAQGIAGYPADVFAFDPREIALLPKFCTYTQHFRARVPGGSDPALIEQWHARLGPDFVHLHHYCYGLMKTNRAVLLARDRTARQFYLSDAIVEFDYVIVRATDDFVLLPEVRLKKGENLVLLGKGPLAVLEFESAIELRKDYWPPYAQLSDYYKDSGDSLKAKEVLVRGLTAAPDAKALQRRLAEMETAGKRAGAKP